MYVSLALWLPEFWQLRHHKEMRKGKSEVGIFHLWFTLLQVFIGWLSLFTKGYSSCHAALFMGTSLQGPNTTPSPSLPVLGVEWYPALASPGVLQHPLFVLTPRHTFIIIFFSYSSLTDRLFCLFPARDLTDSGTISLCYDIWFDPITIIKTIRLQRSLQKLIFIKISYS